MNDNKDMKVFFPIVLPVICIFVFLLSFGFMFEYCGEWFHKMRYPVEWFGYSWGGVILVSGFILIFAIWIPLAFWRKKK